MNSRRTHRPHFGRNAHRRRTALPPDGTPPGQKHDGRGRFRSNRIEIRKPEVFSVNPIRQPDPTHGHRKNRAERDDIREFFLSLINQPLYKTSLSLYAPIKIRHDRICLKPVFDRMGKTTIVSPSCLIISGIFFSVIFIRDLIQGFRDRYWLAALLLFGAGFALHVLQRRKLKFKSIPLSATDGMKDQIRKLLSDEDGGSNTTISVILQATNRKASLSGLRLADLELEKR